MKIIRNHLKLVKILSRKQSLSLQKGDIEAIYETITDSTELIKSEHDTQRQATAKRIEILKEKYHQMKETNTRDLEELGLP